MYWKDVNTGHAKNYIEHGFECVTAGHIYDPLFLSRLKSIIEVSTITMSNALGTHLGYCVFMNKPHFIVEDKIEYKSDNKESLIFESEILDKYLEDSDIKKINNLFSTMRNNITAEQRKIVDLYWGCSYIRGKEEIKEIMMKAESLYNLYVNR